jgi:hypothetical protein
MHPWRHRVTSHQQVSPQHLLQATASFHVRENVCISLTTATSNTSSIVQSI